MPTLSSEPSSKRVLRLGRTCYELIRTLGLARHGELFLARRHVDQRFGGYSVIKRSLPSAEAQRRLLDEARVIAQLSHPNIPGFHHLESQAEGPLLIQEHVAGFRLEGLLLTSERARQPLSEAFACYVVAEVAEALHHAHTSCDEDGRELGIVHRDVTPYNIFIGDHGEVQLLDFGAAWSRLSGREGTEGPAFQGSLAYAAPELVRKTALDGRADQFSLGIVLLQLLTGRHLFEGAERFDARQRQGRGREDGAMRQYAQELARRIRDYSLEDLRQATRSVPVALEPIVHRALAPDGAERFESCAALAHALRDYLRSTQESFGRHEVLAELASLRYVALRVASGEAPEEAVRERLLPEPGHRSVYRVLTSRLSSRLRRSPRRR
jgi:serine/threonine protein kinase